MEKNNRLIAQMDALAPIIREHIARGKSVRISPKGVSMLPMIRQGKDTVTLSPIPEKMKKYDLPLYQREDGKYVLHRIVAVENGYTLIGDNQFVYEKGIKHTQMIAVVTSFTRGKKEYSVTNVFYKMYCRFWHHTRALRHFWRRGIGKLRRILKIKKGAANARI